MAFHHQAQYWSTVAGHRSAVTTTQGIKQGCKIAPFLFVSYTIMVMEILIQRIGHQWVQEGLTIFADDHWAAWKVEDRHTLGRSLKEIQTVIDVLEENGLKLNAKKSAILFDLKGKDVMEELGWAENAFFRFSKAKSPSRFGNHTSTWAPYLHTGNPVS